MQIANHFDANGSAIASCVAAMTGLLFATGCETSNLDKVVVVGEVAFQGEPVKNGEIRFYPAEGTVGPVSGAPIVNGRFVAKAKGGVPVGTHRVKIKGFRPAGAAPPGGSENTALLGGALGPPAQFIPAKYNDASALFVTIEASGGEQTHDFHLEP